MKIALTIAGSDSGGGAGIQADLKTLAALGVFGASAITAITAQNTLGVTDIHEVPTASIAAQIDAVLSDIGADAIKTGMLATAEIVAVVAERLRRHNAERPSAPDAIPLVVDPVIVAKSGDRLLRADAVAAYREILFPMALVVTPNLDEAAELVGRPLEDEAAIRRAGRQIHAMGPRYVVMKGGHRPGPEAVDLVFDGEVYREYRAARVPTRNTHGTGCTFASAIAAGLARGLEVPAAIDLAKRYVTAAVAQAPRIGHGHGPLHHFHQFYDNEGQAAAFSQSAGL